MKPDITYYPESNEIYVDLLPTGKDLVLIAECVEIEEQEVIMVTGDYLTPDYVDSGESIQEQAEEYWRLYPDKFKPLEQ